MNCRHPWNRSYLDSIMTRSWLNGDYKHHREVLLMDREKSLLPATQPAVEHEVECRKRGELLVDIAIQRGKVNERMRELERELQVLDQVAWDHKMFMRNKPGVETVAKERKAFVAACPGSDCRGFLSTAYKCGTCQVRFCPDCREQKVEGHTCDPALVETIKAIVADSKPCPSCGFPISRVSGCDQMYCTQCDTPFSYSTGAVVKGVIHNPHYYERAHAAAAAAAANTAAGGGGPCPGPGGRINWPREPYSSTNRYIRDNYHLRVLYQAGRHVQEVVLEEQLRIRAPDNTDLRVKYLLKDLDEKGFRQQLQQRDKKQLYILELREPLELYVVNTIEFFVALRNNAATISAADLDELVKAYTTGVEELVNKALRVIADRYGRVVPQISMDTSLHVGEAYQTFGYPKKEVKEAKKGSKEVEA
jgi:hypothetical protein